jgi:hypothetical protein
MSERANRKSDGFGARLLPKDRARQSTASAPTDNMTVDADGDAMTPDVVASSISLRTTEKRTKKQSSSANSHAEKRGRDLLLQRRSLLTHAPPDIGRTIRKKSSAAEDAHEFQKVKLRHVDVDLSPKRASVLDHVNYHDALTNHVSTATALQSMESERSEFLHVSFEANCQAERAATKDVVVAMTPAPIQAPREERAESPPRYAQQLANVSHEKTAAATPSATASAAATKKDKTKRKTVPTPRLQSKPEEVKKAAAMREKHDRPQKGFSAPTRAWLLHVGNMQPQPQSEDASQQQQEPQPQQSKQQAAPQKQQKSQIGKHDDEGSKKGTHDVAAKKDISPHEKLKNADAKALKASHAEKRRSESQSRAHATRKISSEKPASDAVPQLKATATATAARRHTPPATRPKPVVAPEELDRRRMQNELLPPPQQQGEKKEIKTGKTLPILVHLARLLQLSRK